MTWLKKTVALLLSAMLCVCGCGCQSATPKLDPKNLVSIELWHYYNGPQKTAFDRLVEEFNETEGAKQGIFVEAFSQGSVNELINQVLNAAEKRVGAGNIPAIFAAYADTAYQIDQMGLVANLDQYLSKQELEEYVDNYIEEGRFDKNGSLKIFPVAKSSEILMLNKTDWDKFSAGTGVTLEGLSTKEKLVETAQRYYEWTDSLTPEPNDGKAFFGYDSMANYFVVGFHQLGSDIFSSKNGEIAFNFDKKILRRLWDNYYIPTVKGYFGSYGRFRSDDAKTGSLIALAGATTGAIYFPDQVVINDTERYPIEALMLELPCFEGGEHYAVQQGAGMVVSKSNPTTEYAATVFLKWFTEERRNIEFSIASAYLPVKKEATTMQSIRQVLQESKLTLSPAVEQALEAATGMMNTHSFCTSKAFPGATETRSVLEHCMKDKAKKDRAAVKAALDAGQTLQEAVKPFATDENFNAWYDVFCAEMEATLK